MQDSDVPAGSGADAVAKATGERDSALAALAKALREDSQGYLYDGSCEIEGLRLCVDMLERSCRAESVGLRGRAGFGGGAGRALGHVWTVRTADGALCTLLGGFVACTFETRPDSVDLVVAQAQKRLFSGLFEGPVDATIRPQTRLKPPSPPSPTPPAPKTLYPLPLHTQLFQ